MPSSGNVFRDLGFRSEEAEHLLIRADLLIHLQNVITTAGLTQTQVATMLHVSQPRVSDLRRGRVDLFSTDTLIDMLSQLGVRVRFVLKPSRRRLKGAALRLLAQTKHERPVRKSSKSEDLPHNLGRSDSTARPRGRGDSRGT